MSFEGLDKAAKSISSQLEHAVGEGGAFTVAAVGFGEDGGKKQTENTRRLEERLNHYIAQSATFKLIEIKDNDVRNLMDIISKQWDLRYKEPLFINFTNIKNIVTGNIERGDVFAEISAKMVSLEKAEVLGSAIAQVPLHAGTRVYLFRLAILSAVLLSLAAIVRRLFLRKRKVSLPRDFQETQCSSCGRTIKDIYQLGGKCTNPTCENPICTDCWNVGRIRKCKTCQERIN